MVSQKTSNQIEKNILPKPERVRKINVSRFERLAKKVKNYLQEEEEKFQKEQVHEYNQRLKLSLRH